MSNGWPTVPLGEVLRHRKEFIEIDDTKQYRRCRVQLHAKGIVQRDIVPGAEIKTKQQQVCRAGEFLVAEIDAKVGGFGIVPHDMDGAIVSSHYFLFPIDEHKLDRKFLDFFVRTPTFREQVTAQGSTNYAAIRPSHVLGYTLPLPPLSEQRRIVAKIEQLASKIEEARGLQGFAIVEGDAILQSTISNLPFDSSEWRTIADGVAQHGGAVRSGPFGSDLHHEEFVESGVMAIGTRDVRTNAFLPQSRWFVTEEKFRAFSRFRVFSGDILTTIVGASIGRFCVVPDDAPLAFTTKHIMAVTMDKMKVAPHFASYMLNYHRRCRDSIFSQCAGSAQPSLNASKVKKTLLPLPPFPEQRRIVAYLDDLQAKVDQLKTLQAATAAELDALLPSILDRAFRGEL